MGIMPRRKAIVTQADVRRVTQAAIQAGASEVEVRPDGRILIHLAPSTAPTEPIEDGKEIVL
jgi:hypothetical protein